MSPAVQRRIRALRKNQLEIIDIETNFYKEMHQLETKYEKLYKEKFDLVLSNCNFVFLKKYFTLLKNVLFNIASWSRFWKP